MNIPNWPVATHVECTFKGLDTNQVEELMEVISKLRQLPSTKWDLTRTQHMYRPSGYDITNAGRPITARPILKIQSKLLRSMTNLENFEYYIRDLHGNLSNESAALTAVCHAPINITRFVQCMAHFIRLHDAPITSAHMVRLPTHLNTNGISVPYS